MRPDGKVYFNSSGTPALATAGSGGVLTGIIVSFLAQGYKPEVAALLGAFVHGVAGEIASRVKWHIRHHCRRYCRLNRKSNTTHNGRVIPYLTNQRDSTPQKLYDDDDSNESRTIGIGSPLIASQASAQQTQKFTATKANEYGLTYTLPVTMLDISIETERIDREPGEFYNYSKNISASIR